MYTVRWKRTALDQLTEIWLSAPDRGLINTAVDEFDQLLSRRPDEAGESRAGNVRVYFCSHLGIFFEVDEGSGTVDVLRVWTF
jgi:plasmid stabilization system protein ParE